MRSGEAREILSKAAAYERLTALRPRDAWNEDDGHVLWYHLPLQEPPYVGMDDEAFNARNADGTPTDFHRLLASGWLTHWSPLPKVSAVSAPESNPSTVL